MSLVDQVLEVMTPAEWAKPIEVDLKWIQFVDENVKTTLPPGSLVDRIIPRGESYWSRTAEISTRQQDGSPKSFFLKVSEGDNGRGMTVGEYASMRALHKVVPDFVPEPIGHGSYASNPSIHFFLSAFVTMEEGEGEEEEEEEDKDGPPEIQAFVKKLAELHTKGLAPPAPHGGGKHWFGFPVPTYKGTIPQYTHWHDTWEEAFHHSMKWFVWAEERAQGPPDAEMATLCHGLFAKVIPRLLRPLETGGRQIQPRLIHGDLWAGNAATCAGTRKPIIYDGACLYAHNELEMAAWRPVRHLIGREYMKAYFDIFPPSAPEEDQDDRNLLYYLRWDLKSSALFPGKLRYREMAKETMRILLAKFPDGYEGWAKAQGEEPVQRVYAPTSYSFLSNNHDTTEP